MGKIKEWVKEKVKKFVNSRFFLAVLCLILASCWTISYYEFQDLWRDYQEALQIFERVRGLSDGAVVSAVALADTEEVSLVNTEREAESTQSPLPLEEILDRIKILESSGGKNNAPACEIQRKINFYGYGVNKMQTFCYDNEEANRRAVRDWLLRQESKGLTLPQILCRYNTGIISEDCEYYKNFRSIK